MADLKTDLAECVRLVEIAMSRDRWTTPRTIADACINLFHDHGDELLAAVRDAERYRWLAGSQNCSLSVSHNDHHNMYQTVEDTLDEPQGYYDEVDDAERERMIATDTIWTVHVYPNTPVGFNVYHGATLDAAIDAAIDGRAGG